MFSFSDIDRLSQEVFSKQVVGGSFSISCSVVTTLAYRSQLIQMLLLNPLTLLSLLLQRVRFIEEPLALSNCVMVLVSTGTLQATIVLVVIDGTGLCSSKPLNELLGFRLGSIFGQNIRLPIDVRRAPLPHAQCDNSCEARWNTGRMIDRNLAIDQAGRDPAPIQ